MTDITIQNLDTANIVPGDNDRRSFDTVELEKLAESLNEHGLAQPITLRPIEGKTERYEIVAGERRFRASQLLGWDSIPAIVRELNDEQAAAIMLVENVLRVDLNPIDEAKAYSKRAQQFGWSAPQIAAQAKVPVSRVRARLALLDLIPEAQVLVQGGSMGLGFADAMVDLDGNRQYLALRYFSQTDRPTLTEFRSLVGELLAAQAQDTMFDVDAFLAMSQATAEDAGSVGDTAKRYPTSDKIPPMQGAVSIGGAFERYIAELMSSPNPDHRAAAEVAGTIYDSLLRANLAKPPKASPLA